MSLRKSFKDFIAEARQSDAYWVERAKHGFALALERWRRSKGLSNAELAQKIGASPAYMTKVFRGDTNFTIETMVKLARACGGELSIQIEEPSVSASWLDAPVLRRATSVPRKVAVGASGAAQTSVIYLAAANNEWFSSELRLAA